MTGPTATNNSVTFWSTTQQKIIKTGHSTGTDSGYQLTQFEQTPIVPTSITSTWTASGTNNTTFTGTVSGCYLITYRLDILFANTSGDSGSTVAIALAPTTGLTGATFVPQSQTFVSSPDDDEHIMAGSATFLYQYTAGTPLTIQVASNIALQSTFNYIGAGGNVGIPTSGSTFTNFAEVTALLTIVQVA